VVRSPLIGRFQSANVAKAVRICAALHRRGVAIDREAVLAGAASARWRGRMQWVDGNPPVLVDGAHNPDGMRAFVEALGAVRDQRRVAVVFAAMRDKDVAAMAATLAAAEPACVVVTAPNVERARPAEELATLFTGATAAGETATALKLAASAAGPDGLVAVCGSLYLAGEVLTLLET
jgi:dihydrofolate synthase/folylpolyglutamate synthase